MGSYTGCKRFFFFFLIPRCQLVSWCFEPSQPQRTISGLPPSCQFSFRYVSLMSLIRVNFGFTDVVQTCFFPSREVIFHTLQIYSKKQIQPKSDVMGELVTQFLDFRVPSTTEGHLREIMGEKWKNIGLSCPGKQRQSLRCLPVRLHSYTRACMRK